MLNKLRRAELELDSDRTNLDLLERYIVISQRMGRDFTKDWFPRIFSDIKKLFNKNKNMMEKYIELQSRYSFGYPAWVACLMVSDCISDRKWAEEIIERSKIEDNAYAAYVMVRYCGSDRKWAEKVIESAKNGDPAYAAGLMVEYCGSSQEWANKAKKSK